MLTEGRGILVERQFAYNMTLVILGVIAMSSIVGTIVPQKEDTGSHQHPGGHNAVCEQIPNYDLGTIVDY